jgi:hypothetical protein
MFNSIYSGNSAALKIRGFFDDALRSLLCGIGGIYSDDEDIKRRRKRLKGVFVSLLCPHYLKLVLLLIF